MNLYKMIVVPIAQNIEALLWFLVFYFKLHLNLWDFESSKKLSLKYRYILCLRTKNKKILRSYFNSHPPGYRFRAQVTMNENIPMSLLHRAHKDSGTFIRLVAMSNPKNTVHLITKGFIAITSGKIEKDTNYIRRIYQHANCPTWIKNVIKTKYHYINLHWPERRLDLLHASFFGRGKL